MSDTTEFFSRDGENFSHRDASGVFEELDCDDELVEGRIYYVGDFRPLGPSDFVSHIDSTITEQLDCTLFDFIGEDSAEDVFDVPEEARAELRKAVSEWITKHIDVGRFFKIVGSPRELKVTAQDVEEHHV